MKFRIEKSDLVFRSRTNNITIYVFNDWIVVYISLWIHSPRSLLKDFDYTFVSTYLFILEWSTRTLPSVRERFCRRIYTDGQSRVKRDELGFSLVLSWTVWLITMGLSDTINVQLGKIFFYSTRQSFEDERRSLVNERFISVRNVN